MLYDWSFAERVRCSEDERSQCAGLVSELVELAAKARRLGLLSLLDTIAPDQHFLLRKGLQLMVDGVKPEVVRQILEIYILSDGCRGKELLVRCLILEGVSGIQLGLNPKTIREILLSFFGCGGESFHGEIFQKSHEKGGLEKLLRTLHAAPEGETPPCSLGALIQQIDDHTIRECLKEVSTRELAAAVGGMGGRTQLRIFKNLPQRGAVYLQKMLAQMDPVDPSDMAAAQKKIQSIISDLNARGAIRFPDQTAAEDPPAAGDRRGDTMPFRSRKPAYPGTSPTVSSRKRKALS